MDVRRSEGRPRLRPGDVLLVHGDGAVSWAIRRFDESDVDRAAVVLDGERVAEISATGPKVRPWDDLVAEGRFAYIRRLPEQVDALPVAERARALLAEGSGLVDRRLVALAVLSMTRRLPLASPSFRTLIRALLDRASETVDGMVGDGRGWMPTSHLVYRAFEGCGDPHASLSIMFPAVHPSPTLPSTSPTSGETTLIGWAMGRREPAVVPRLSSVEMITDGELDAAIATFAVEDSPQDPFASSVSARRVPAEVVSDDDLLVSAVRFRNRLNRFAAAPGPDPWAAFRATTDLVTPADLRYTPSLITIGSVRPEHRRAMVDG